MLSSFFRSYGIKKQGKTRETEEIKDLDLKGSQIKSSDILYGGLSDAEDDLRDTTIVEDEFEPNLDTDSEEEDDGMTFSDKINI
jgi:hypothetical protein